MHSDGASTHPEPKVAVVIAAYNEEKYIQSSVNSALGQTYGNLEIIVVNDGSTDSTLALLQPFEGRIKILNQENSGPAASRNAGMDATDADYLAILDADDLWFPEKIAKQMQIMLSYPDVVFVGSSPWRIDADGNRLYDAPDRPFCADKPVNLRNALLSLGNLRGLGPSGCLIRRSAFIEAGKFRDIFAEDYELWIRLSELGNFFLMSEPLYYYRVRPSSLTTSDTTREFQCEIDILNMHRDKYDACTRKRRLSIIHCKWADSLVYKQEPGALKRILLGIMYNPLNCKLYVLMAKFFVKKTLYWRSQSTA